jgi:hypothetical protein
MDSVPNEYGPYNTMQPSFLFIYFYLSKKKTGIHLQVSLEMHGLPASPVESITACNGVSGMWSRHPQAMLPFWHGREMSSLQKDDWKGLVNYSIP